MAFERAAVADLLKGVILALEVSDRWRCGQKGALALAEFIAESPVSCRTIDTDSYGRVVANCHVMDRDIEEWLVREGWAIAYRRYSSDYIGAEQVAKNAKRGIWAGTVQAPWEWRHNRCDRSKRAISR
jgi:endonuclease YncB( thermonuclease family)